jgi:isochorismate hydrolase
MSKYKGTSQTDQDLIRAIGYITDMKYIASYYGVDVKRVIALRDKIKKPRKEVVRPEVEYATTAKPNAQSAGLNSDSERKWNKNAREGSAALLKALLKFYENRERRIKEGGAA